MTTLQFLHHLRDNDIKIWMENGKLRFRAPEKALTPELRGELTRRKPEIIKFLEQIVDDPRAAMPRIQPVPRDRHLRLSFAQERLWFLDQLDPGSTAYNIYDQFEIDKPIDVDILQRSLDEVVRRHEILRTTFQNVDGLPVQVIGPPVPFDLKFIDLTHLPIAERRPEAEKIAAEEARRPFDLAKGPLLRLKLLQLGTEHFVWLHTIHHIITDDWSKKLFDHEVDILYKAFSQGLPSPLPELTIQYGDFAAWKRKWFSDKILDSHTEFWMSQLQGDLPVLEMPTDRPQKHSDGGATGKFRFSRQLFQAVRTLSGCEGVTPFMVFLAGHSALLSRYAGQDDIIIGTSIADRDNVETEQVIGFMLNTLPLRIRLPHNPTFRQHMRHVREVCIGAQAHQEVPYEDLLRRLRNRNLTGNPLFQTMLGLLNTPSIAKSSFWGPDPAAAHLPPSDYERFKIARHNGTTKFNLSISLVQDDQFYRGTAEYSTDLFDEETIAVLLDRLQILLLSAASDPDQRISELPLITEAQQREVLVNWNGLDVKFPGGQCVHQLFETQVVRTPEALAIQYNGERLSYRELNSRTNRLARYLVRLGAGPETMVGIFLHRSPEMVVAKLATLKAGGACVPLDPLYPVKLLDFIIKDSGITLLITDSSLVNNLPMHSAQVICLDKDGKEIGDESESDLACRVWPECRACVLYTSGSTGRPKGVMLTHDALVNYTVSALQYYELGPEDRVLQFASMSFDAILEEIYPALSRGATVVLRTGDMLDSIRIFLAYCRQLEITAIVLPTAYWHEIVDRLEVEELPRTLRVLIIGGERACPERVAVWQKLVDGRVRLVNTYGPTEGTIAVTRCDLQTVDITHGREAPIGRAIENTKLYVIDRWMQPAPVGIPGELLIGGAALARGYLNRPDLTAEKFIPDFLSDQPGARLYQTGDVVRSLPGGFLEFRGRTDNQVKIRGYRVEPGEIEAVLQSYQAVKDSVVTAREDNVGLKQLVAYVVLRDGYDVTASNLRSFLKEGLPEYMVPSFFVFLPKLPLTSSGKINRQALPKPDHNPADNGEYVSPRTSTEKTLESIWTSVLKLDRIGIYDNFFELGSHSLLATQVVARISDTLHIELPLRRLFELPTIAELAVAVEGAIQSGAGERPRIVSVRALVHASAASESAQTSDAELSVDSSVSGQSIEQMLAGLEGLTEQEVMALLGEDAASESSD